MATTTPDGGWPDATNTGLPPGVTLTASGDLVITKAGTVISGLNITGTVTIEAANVTLENCKITSASVFVVNVATGVTGAVVQNCEINGVGSGNSGSCGINGQGTFIGNNIYNVENGINLTGSSVVENNYIHGLQASGSPHYDGIQIDGGVSNITISHNTVINENGSVSAIMIDNYWGAVSNISVDNNLLVGGGFTVYDDGHFNSNSITGVSFTNNHMGSGGYGITDFNGTNPTYTGNVTDGAALAAALNTATNSSSGTTTPPPAPNAPVITSGNHVTNDNTVTVTGTAVAGSTVTVFDGAAKLGTATVNSSGAWTYTTAALSDGQHSLTATDTSSGKTSAASSVATVTVDTHAPAAPVLVSDSVVNTNHVLLSGTAEANSAITVYDGTTAVGTATAGTNGAWSVTTGALATGSQVLTATATDAAGNTSAHSQGLDPVIGSAASPSAPTIVSYSQDSGVVGDGITNDSTLTLTGTAAANSAVKVYDGSTLVGTTTANSSGSWSDILAVLTDAKHTLTAIATNSSGQSSAASSALAVTIDTHAPAAPILVSDSVVNTNHVLLSGTAEANSAITVYDGTTAVGTATAGTNGAWSVTTGALATGSQVLTATATDVAGNISALSQALDPVIGSSASPSAPTIVSYSQDSGVVGDHITNDNTLILTGTAAANSTVTVFDGTSKIGTATTNSSGAWNYTTAALSDGNHSLMATDTDSSGHTSSASSALAVTIDTHAPAAPTMAAYTQGGAAVGATTTVDDLLLKGTAEANSAIHVFDGGKQVGTATTNGSGLWSFDTGHLADGSHSFTSTAIDAAGNTSTASAADAVSVTTPPTSSAPKPIEFTDVDYAPWNHTATINGTADAYSQIKLYDGTTSLGIVTASANGSWSLTTSNLSNTLHTIKAQELDQTGHVVETSSGAVILAGSNTSTLKATGGDDFLFSSSSNLNDTFVFASNFGHSTIEGFTVAGSGQDTVQFSKSVFNNFADVLSHATQSGQNVVISDHSGDTLTLNNVKLAALNPHDFHFA